MAQKALFPMKYHRMTQGRDIEHDVRPPASHYADNNAFDFGQNFDDTVDGRQAYAPYDCKIVFINEKYGAVFIESIGDVIAPEGKVCKQWMALLHTNDVSDAKTWKRNNTTIRQGDRFYVLGNKDVATIPIHLHLECGYGDSPNDWESYGYIQGSNRSRVPGA